MAAAAAIAGLAVLGTFWPESKPKPKEVKHKDEGPFALPAVLSASEADAVAETLLASPEKFVHFIYPLPFFTVGAYHEYHKEKNESAARQLTDPTWRVDGVSKMTKTLSHSLPLNVFATLHNANACTNQLGDVALVVV